MVNYINKKGKFMGISADKEFLYEGDEGRGGDVG